MHHIAAATLYSLSLTLCSYITQKKHPLFPPVLHKHPLWFPIPFYTLALVALWSPSSHLPRVVAIRANYFLLRSGVIVEAQRTVDWTGRGPALCSISFPWLSQGQGEWYLYQPPIFAKRPPPTAEEDTYFFVCKYVCWTGPGCLQIELGRRSPSTGLRQSLEGGNRLLYGGQSPAVSVGEW